MFLNHSPHRPLFAAGGIALAVLLGATACSGESGGTPPGIESTTPPGAEPAPTQAIGKQTIVHRDGYAISSYLTAGTEGTIVFDAGGGNDASYWNDLVPALSSATGATILTYDRTGVGQSDEVPGAFSPAAAGEDLAAVIRDSDLPAGPVVLAGHSIAGEVAHALVNSHSGLIDGAVLVDANLPPFFTPSEIARLVKANEAAVTELKAGPSTRQSRQFIAAAENWGPVHTAFHSVTWPKDIRVAVIVSDQTPFPAESDDAQNWRDAARVFVGEASNRSLVTAEGTSHDVPLDNPQLVETEIERVFGEL